MNRYAAIILKKLHLVTERDHKAVVDTLRNIAYNDSRLAADLLGMCRDLEKDNDKLSDENADLLEVLKDINNMLNDVLHYPLFTPVNDTGVNVRETLEEIRAIVEQALNQP